jgi:4-amino-4-deoxychorismate lyase
MSQLIETVKLLDGKFYNLSYHERRMVRSLKYLFNKTGRIRLDELLHETPFPQKGLYKCRLLYNDVAKQIEYTSYEPRKVNRLRIVEDDLITYPFKLVKRQPINRLFAMRGECDDVLIIRRGKVTDCSYANIAFRKGSNWFTPASPLLEGTMRQQLLDKNKVTAREIRREDIRSFDTCKIINAMLEFDSPEIDVSDIVF